MTSIFPHHLSVVTTHRTAGSIVFPNLKTSELTSFLCTSYSLSNDDGRVWERLPPQASAVSAPVSLGISQLFHLSNSFPFSTWASSPVQPPGIQICVEYLTWLIVRQKAARKAQRSCHFAIKLRIEAVTLWRSSSVSNSGRRNTRRIISLPSQVPRGLDGLSWACISRHWLA